MNVVLIGFMGSGKSSVALGLAKKLKMKMVDMDDLVLKSSGRKSISEIFKKDGEIRFRELEVSVGKKVARRKSAVIATGGGVVMNKIILDFLRINGQVIYLKTSLESIFNRIKKSEDRPLFKNFHEIKYLLKLREPLYKAYADFVISTDHKNVSEVINSIIKRLDKYGRE